MNPDQFFFHDLTHFPIVTARHDGAQPGYSTARELLGQAGPGGFNVD